MRAINEQYYQGFEGEPEIIFCTKTTKGSSFGIWSGYFDEIMSRIKPTSKGWEGLAYYYQMEEGWYDESPWKIPDIKLVHSQLNSINVEDLDNVCKEILSSIINLLKEAINEKAEVLIYYE